MANRVLVTGPAEEPVTPQDMLLHSHLDEMPADASILRSQIEAAREYAETYTRRKLITQTWDISYDRFDSCLWLPFQPVQSITSVSYSDVNGVTQTLATSVYEIGRRNGLDVVRLKYGQTWPSTRDHADAVTIRMVCGYGLAMAVPERLKLAIRMLAAHWYANRNPVNIGNIVTKIDFTVESLLDPFRVVELG